MMLKLLATININILIFIKEFNIHINCNYLVLMYIQMEIENNMVND